MSFGRNVFGRDVELQLLDGNFNVVTIIDNFESFIWTERFNQYGDFQIRIPGVGGQIGVYRPARYVRLSVSRTLMIIESAKAGVESDGREVLQVVGKSYDSIFQERVVSTGRSFTNSSPGYIAQQLVKDICIDGNGASSLDVVPHLMQDPNDASTFQTDAELKTQNLYTAIKELCDSDGLGFRIRYEPEPERNRGDKFLVFRISRGNDRTSASVHGLDETQVVVFSQDTDNLSSGTYIRTNEDVKNTAYVWHDSRSSPVIVRLTEFAHSGVSRRVISVDANDIENPSTSALEQRGREVLSEHNRREVVDGEADIFRGFVYSLNYFLGDLVEVWHPDGRKVKSRVMEHIWSFDSSGLRAYPTLEYVEDL